MTLNNLLNYLKTLDVTLPLIFTFEGGEIGSGYHVTEIKTSNITSIDCGGQISEWSEVAIQLLDGQGVQHMKASKLVSILEHSLGRLTRLGDKPLYFEFAPQNIGLQLFSLEKIDVSNDRISVQLIEKRAICKPARKATGGKSKSSCCGEDLHETACCA
ncbi:MAG: hypothetical protein DHS20C07_15470 [Methyloligella sp.]|nr:MAG: hypothetical protein DHS20C07_15470 [Methyloligella sp.]